MHVAHAQKKKTSRLNNDVFEVTRARLHLPQLRGLKLLRISGAPPCVSGETMVAQATIDAAAADTIVYQQKTQNLPWAQTTDRGLNAEKLADNASMTKGSPTIAQSNVFRTSVYVTKEPPTMITVEGASKAHVA